MAGAKARMGNSGYWPYSTLVFFASGSHVDFERCDVLELGWWGRVGPGGRDPESLSRIIFCTWVLKMPSFSVWRARATLRFLVIIMTVCVAGKVFEMPRACRGFL